MVKPMRCRCSALMIRVMKLDPPHSPTLPRSLQQEGDWRLSLHVDDMFMAGDKEFRDCVICGLRRDFQIGSEDKNDIMFVGQRIRWIVDGKTWSTHQGRPRSVH